MSVSTHWPWVLMAPGEVDNGNPGSIDENEALPPVCQFVAIPILVAPDHRVIASVTLNKGGFPADNQCPCTRREGAGGKLVVDSIHKAQSCQVEGAGAAEVDDFYEFEVVLVRPPGSDLCVRRAPGVIHYFGDREGGGCGWNEGAGSGDAYILCTENVSTKVQGLKSDLIRSGINGDISLPAVVVDPGQGEGFTGICEADLADIDPGVAPDLDEGVAGCCAGWSSNAEGNLGNRSVDRAESVVPSVVNVTEVGSQVFRRKETGVVTGPRGQVSGVEGGIDDVLEMPVVGSFVGRTGR